MQNVKPVAYFFCLETIITSACFAQNVCILQQQTCNLQAGTESPRPCIVI